MNIYFLNVCQRREVCQEDQFYDHYILDRKMDDWIFNIALKYNRYVHCFQLNEEIIILTDWVLLGLSIRWDMWFICALIINYSQWVAISSL